MKRKNQRPQLSHGKKKSIAGRQNHQCNNKPGSKLKRLEDYACPFWQKQTAPGNFDESGFEVDHIEEVANGGEDKDENLQALCLPCHAVKTRRFLMTKNDGDTLPAPPEGPKEESKTAAGAELNDIEAWWLECLVKQRIGARIFADEHLIESWQEGKEKRDQLEHAIHLSHIKLKRYYKLKNCNLESPEYKALSSEFDTLVNLRTTLPLVKAPHHWDELELNDAFCFNTEQKSDSTFLKKFKQAALILSKGRGQKFVLASWEQQKAHWQEKHHGFEWPAPAI